VFSDFRNRHSAKISQFDDCRSALIVSREPLQRVVQDNDFVRAHRRNDRHVLDSSSNRAAAALLISVPSSMVDKDPAHEAGRHRKKLRPMPSSTCARIRAGAQNT
jgi:hypothetical protein